MSLIHEFAPIFRLVNDYERASRCQPRAAVRSFKPAFDVKELEQSYELTGELAGIDQKNVNVEWSDATTLIIKGHTEYRAQKAAPKAAPTESTSTEPKSRQPSVEDEEGNESSHSEEFVEVDSHTEEKTAQDPDVSVPAPTEDKAKYWVSERSVGTFQRSFTFPVRVETDGVKAGLKNGILTVVVPKAKIPEPRRIVIE